MAEKLDLEVKPKRSKLLLIIIIVAVLLLGGGSAGAYFLFFAGGDSEAAAADNEAAAKAANNEAEADKGDAIYVAIPGAFVFHVPGISRDRQVEIKAQLMVRGDDAEMLVKKNIPLVKATLLQTFSKGTAETLATVDGKEALRAQALDDTRAALTKITGQPLVEQVLFTGFVMQ